LSMTN